MNAFREVELFGSEADGRLLLHSLPGRFEVLESFLALAEREAVDAIFNLVPDSEIAHKSPDYLVWLREPTIPVVRSPIPDYGIPEDAQTLRRSVDEIVELLYQGRTVLGHCGAGIGRSAIFGTIVASELGFDLPEAITRVREAGSAVESEEQDQFVRNFLMGT